MSAYPSTATLAAFRRSILPPETGEWPPARTSDSGMVHPSHGGAWPDELVLGIGYRCHAECNRPGSWCNVTSARREASALRSRAYPDALIDPDDFAAFGFR